jgi:hypothetical protein
MHYRLYTEDRLFALRWLEISAEGVRAMSREFVAYASRCDAPLLFGAVISTRVGIPDAAARQTARDELVQYSDRIGATRLIVLGDGLRQTLIRGVLVNIALLGTPRGQRPEVDGSAEAFAAAVETQLAIPAAGLLTRLVDAGVVLPQELSR